MTRVMTFTTRCAHDTLVNKEDFPSLIRILVNKNEESWSDKAP